MQLRLEDISEPNMVEVAPAMVHFAPMQARVTLGKRTPNRPPNWRDRLKDSLLIVVVVTRAIRDGLDAADRLREWLQRWGFTSHKQRGEASDVPLEALSKSQP